MSLCVSKRGVPPTEFSGWRKLHAGSLACNCWVQENDAGFICSSFRPPKSEQFKKTFITSQVSCISMPIPNQRNPSTRPSSSLPVWVGEEEAW